MLQTLEQLVADYGYVAILIGTFFEGETILLVGAFAAHQGYLRIDLVILIAFIGSCAGDQFWYMLGRRYGRARLLKRPILADRIERITRWLDRYPTAFILGFRFVYGIRNIAPVAIALSKIPPWRFYVLNVVAAALWAATGGLAGYIFGAAVEAFVGNLKAFEQRVLAGVALAVIGYLVGRWLYRWFRKVPPAPPGRERIGSGPPQR
jgi:membrane protein DedA with SNARE-associated domain